MKFLFFLIFALASCSNPNLPPKSSLVSTPSNTGTAFAVTPTSYLTAWHVVRGRKPIEIAVHQQRAHQIIRIGNLDAAIITMPKPHNQPLWELDTRIPAHRETVFVSGYGDGDYWTSQGLAQGDGRFSLSIVEGDSGAPIYGQNGKVVAIATSYNNHHHCWGVLVSKVANHPQSKSLPLPPRD